MFALLVIGNFIIFSRIESLSHAFSLALTSYLYAMIFIAVAAFPVALLVRVVKKIEGLDEYDHETDFNPFKVIIT